MKKLLLCLLILLMCAHVALAQPTLDASMSDGLMAIHWTGCTCQQATLTLYRDGWPVLVACVCGADGSYDVPIWYTQEAGSYAVQLRCAEGCMRADAGNVNTPPTDVSPEPTEVSNTTSPTATPMPRPTEKPGTVPTVRPTPAPTQVAGDPLPALADEVIRQTNMERTSRGLGTLRVDAGLNRAAAVRARELVESFSHTRPDGSSWSTVSSAASGENIARGHDSADRVMAAWMSSEGHRANILRAGFTRIGVCAYEADGILYWVQLFSA